MKIEYAEPGTDPTQIPSKHAAIGPAAFLRSNGALLVGVAIFVILGATKFLNNGDKTAPTATPTPAPTAVVARVQPVDDDAYPGWCELNGTLIPPGEHQVGSEVRRCLEGIWFTDDGPQQ